MSEPTLAYVIGTRPNFVKMAPLIAAMRARFPALRHSLIHTGQHYDELMSGIFLDELGVPPPDHMLGVGSGSHGAQCAAVIRAIDPILAAEQPRLIFVPGDVNSTLAAALAARQRGVAIVHIESGLRSFDRSMPEEINRIVVDRLSEVLVVHSDEAIDNLRAEGVAEGRILFAGNTMIDTLRALEQRFRSRRTHASLGLDAGRYLLVTLHRPALVDGPLLAAAVEALASVAERIPVLFPAHPRTRKAIESLGGAGRLRLTEPVGYLDFLSLQSDAAAVLTDSGGIQEESSCLGVPCFTLRDNTERPVTVRLGSNTLLGLDPRRIEQIPQLIETTPRRAAEIPGWDGRAAPRIVEAIAARCGL